MLTEKQQRTAAAEFIKRWQGRGYEKGESQLFWIDLLTNVYGISDAASFICFEQQARLDHTSFIDAMIPSTHVMIEQKSLGKNLRQPIKQSDGNMLTPFQQAQRYSAVLPYSERPRWIVTCNFAEFDVYDMENPKGEPSRIELKDLEREYYRLQFLVEVRSVHLERELQVSMQAGEIVGRIYDELIKQYDETDPMALRSLNILCVRLVFCLYAEDAGVFPRHDMFHDYLEAVDAPFMRMALQQLFDTLNTPTDKRSKYLTPALAAFPYTNGGLFAEETDIPQFTPELRNTLLKHASLDFDWSLISPTIFGGVFESTLNPETRRAGGMHYTSIENIHKVIDPLFMNQLWREFEACKELPNEKKRVAALLALQDKMAGLRFFDPACGSGNFLTETYLSLRRLENEILSIVYNRIERSFFENPIKVNIHQFYGIEINDFAVTVATTALWISEAQMIAETERIINHDIDFLPLKSYANIHEGNSLRTDWNSVCHKSELDYIIGNPPFCGRRYRTEEQIKDVSIFFEYKDIDYVACWYKKAAMFIQDTKIRCAFVSTNSISQGEQVKALWKELFEKYNISINFAYPTFKWESESNKKAAVFCVIIGFSLKGVVGSNKTIYDGTCMLSVSNINGYLMDAPNIFIDNRNKPLCNVPFMRNGNVPLDGDALKVEKEDYSLFKNCKHLLKRLIGGRELLHDEKRYVLWLTNVSPHEIKKYPEVYKRVELCRQNRLKMKDKATKKLAETPTTFRDTVNPEYYIALPMVSSERRRYIPMAYFDQNTIPTNQVQIIPSATLYHFGVLESNVHMAWMRAVCGRLKSDYRYSKDIVYNNFPWPEATDEQRAEIAQAAQRILDARQLYPDSSLADLYDPTLMPHELLKAHRDNDRLVMRLYGFPTSMTETECVAQLFKLYQKKCKG